LLLLLICIKLGLDAHFSEWHQPKNGLIKHRTPTFPFGGITFSLFHPLFPWQQFGARLRDNDPLK